MKLSTTSNDISFSNLVTSSNTKIADAFLLALLKYVGSEAVGLSIVIVLPGSYFFPNASVSETMFVILPELKLSIAISFALLILYVLPVFALIDRLLTLVYPAPASITLTLVRLFDPSNVTIILALLLKSFVPSYDELGLLM